MSGRASAYKQTEPLHAGGAGGRGAHGAKKILKGNKVIKMKRKQHAVSTKASSELIPATDALADLADLGMHTDTTETLGRPARREGSHDAVADELDGPLGRESRAAAEQAAELVNLSEMHTDDIEELLDMGSTSTGTGTALAPAPDPDPDPEQQAAEAATRIQSVLRGRKAREVKHWCAEFQQRLQNDARPGMCI